MAPNIHGLPAELLEAILRRASDDWHFMLAMACKRWKAILTDMHRRGKQSTIRRVPLSIALYNLQLAVWSYEHGLKLTERVCEVLAVLQWLRVNGCPWDAYAVTQSTAEVVAYAVANGW